MWVGKKRSAPVPSPKSEAASFHAASKRPLLAGWGGESPGVKLSATPAGGSQWKHPTTCSIPTSQNGSPMLKRMSPVVWVAPPGMLQVLDVRSHQCSAGAWPISSAINRRVDLGTTPLANLQHDDDPKTSCLHLILRKWRLAVTRRLAAQVSSQLRLGRGLQRLMISANSALRWQMMRGAARYYWERHSQTRALSRLAAWRVAASLRRARASVASRWHSDGSLFVSQSGLGEAVRNMSPASDLASDLTASQAACPSVCACSPCNCATKLARGSQSSTGTHPSNSPEPASISSTPEPSPTCATITVPVEADSEPTRPLPSATNPREVHVGWQPPDPPFRLAACCAPHVGSLPRRIIPRPSPPPSPPPHPQLHLRNSLSPPSTAVPVCHSSKSDHLTVCHPPALSSTYFRPPTSPRPSSPSAPPPHVPVPVPQAVPLSREASPTAPLLAAQETPPRPIGTNLHHLTELRHSTELYRPTEMHHPSPVPLESSNVSSVVTAHPSPPPRLPPAPPHEQGGGLVRTTVAVGAGVRVDATLQDGVGREGCGCQCAEWWLGGVQQGCVAQEAKRVPLPDMERGERVERGRSILPKRRAVGICAAALARVEWDETEVPRRVEVAT